MRRPVGCVVLTVIYVLLALNAWAQVALVAVGRSDEPLGLTALQTLVGAASAAAGWGSWRAARWASMAALAHGALTAGMILALMPLLDLEANALGGLAVGAAGLLLFSFVSAWYLRRAITRPTAAAQASSARA